MPSSYTSNVAIEKPADGEQVGSWGDTVNDNMDIIDRLTSQVGSIALTGATHTLTTSTSGALSDGHYSVLKFTGTPGATCVVTINPNTIERIYIVYNTSNQIVTMTQGSGGNVDIPAGKTKIVYSDGAGSGAQVVDLSAGLTSATLTAIGDLPVTDGNFIVGNGSTWVAESGNTVLASLGVTATAAEINIMDGVTATTAEINIMDGVTATTAELNIMDGVTATAAELNIMDGVTATTTELNYVSGVTSAIQTQLDAKQAGDATLTALAGTLTAANKIPYATGTDSAGELDFVDEDNMSSDSATALPSQQSVKAYVDTKVAAVDVGGDYASDARNAIGQLHLDVYTVGYNGSNAFSRGSTYDGASIGQTSGQNWLCMSTSKIGVTFFGSEYNYYVNLFKRTS